jgi:integrase
MATIERRPQRDGTPRYRVKVRVHGGRPHTATFPTLAAARRWAHATEAARREQRYFPPPEAARHTVAELVERYTRTVLPRKSPGSARTQASKLAWWQAELGAQRLTDVTPALLVTCRDRLAEDRAPATVNGYLAALSHAFTVAVTEWQWLEASPLERVRRLREPLGRGRCLTEDERPRLLAACDASSNRFLAPVVVLALSTGARKQEILGLTWADVDLRRATVTFQHTKNRTRRTLPLVRRALEDVQQLAKVRRLDTPLLFPRVDGRRPIDLRYAWAQALQAAGITDFRVHDLRHSAASYLAMSGASLVEIAAILGHQTLQMVQRYAHLAEGHTAGVVARMNAALFP